MIVHSRRLRVEERKTARKVVRTLAFFLLSMVILVYIGLPLMAKAILTFSSSKEEKTVSNPASSFLILPPILDPISQATNSSHIKISGYTDSETTVRIFLNDKETVKVLADKEGKFLSSRLLLSEGENTITATAVKDQKESSSSSTLTITYKKTPPQLEINSPSEGEKFSEERKEIAIEGETDSGNRIVINDRFVIVDQNGKFSYPVALSEGENHFKIIATDPAGNQTVIERKVTFTP